jgi:c-di-GMP-binding flagellar brake protein YcgR
MGDSPDNRRQYNRLKADVNVQLFYLDPDKTSASYSTRTADISAGGLLVCSENPFSIGTSVIVKFSLPGKEAALDLVARVVRVEELLCKKGYDVGLAFLDPQDDRLSEIESYVIREVREKD